MSRRILPLSIVPRHGVRGDLDRDDLRAMVMDHNPTSWAFAGAMGIYRQAPICKPRGVREVLSRIFGEHEPFFGRVDFPSCGASLGTWRRSAPPCGARAWESPRVNTSALLTVVTATAGALWPVAAGQLTHRLRIRRSSQG